MTDAEHDDHERCVQAWLARQREAASGAEGTAAALLGGLRALWSRARPTLGEAATVAIFRRAIEAAGRRHPQLSSLGLRVTEQGDIEISHPPTAPVNLTASAIFLLVEVLRVIARLTSGALTVGLHAALAEAVVERSSGVDPASAERGA